MLSRYRSSSSISVLGVEDCRRGVTEKRMWILKHRFMQNRAACLRGFVCRGGAAPAKNMSRFYKNVAFLQLFAVAS